MTTTDLQRDRIEITDPATGEWVGGVTFADERAVDQAVRAARAAQGAWTAVPAVERGAR